MTRRFLFPYAVFAVCAALAPSGAQAKIPVGTPTYRGARQPAMLSQYERSVLEIEYAKLVKAIREARAEAARDESLRPLREALDEARAAEGPGGTNSVAAARALSDATETLLYGIEGIPAKIKRLHEVGNLLEYDHRLRREQRAAAAAGKPLPKPPESAGEGASGDGGAEEGPAGRDGAPEAGGAEGSAASRGGDDPE